jgi:cell division protein FtsA
MGTSKFCVLVGEVDENGHLDVIGRGEAPSAGSVVKGEIVDMEKAGDQLAKALEEADRASGRSLALSHLMMVLVTGCGISSQPGVGMVLIRNDEHVVTDAERREANDNARVLNLAAERKIINTSESFFLVDGRRVSNPLRHHGSKLEAHIHIVHGISARVDNFRNLLRESGFEDTDIDVVFSPVAADFGVLSEREREDGVLLIDLGAGCTEYVMEYDNGLCASGVLQVGMEHVANDLSIGLGLSIDQCRKLLVSGEMERAAERGESQLTLRGGTGSERSIPLCSFDTIIDCRLREIFTIIRRQLELAGSPRSLAAGGVLTGGGALFPRARELFSEVFDLSCQVAQPRDAEGAITDLASPRYSAVWGALKIAAHYRNGGSAAGNGGFWSLWDNLAVSLRRGRGKLGKALKF